MMSPRSGQNQNALPLFDWPESRDIEKLVAERKMLRGRIAVLPPNAHARIALQVRLEDVTRRLLMLEQAVARKAQP